MKLIEMELREIQISEAGNHQIILLAEKDGERVFPIFIGFFEAAAMDQAVRCIPTPRPMTHDLIGNVIDGLGAKLKQVLVDALIDDTFHGKLVIETQDQREVLVDTRPSDAIVLACKREIPIFVAEEVLEEVLRHQNQASSYDDSLDTSEEAGEDPDDNPFKL